MVEVHFDFSEVRLNVFDIPLYVCVSRTTSCIEREISRQKKRQETIRVPAQEEVWQRVTTPWTKTEERLPEKLGGYFLVVKTDGGIGGQEIRFAEYTEDGEFVDNQRLAPFIYMKNTIKKETIIACTPIPEGAIEE